MYSRRQIAPMNPQFVWMFLRSHSKTKLQAQTHETSKSIKKIKSGLNNTEKGRKQENVSKEIT